MNDKKIEAGKIVISRGVYTVYETINIKEHETFASALERAVKEGKVKYEPHR